MTKHSPASPPHRSHESQATGHAPDLGLLPQWNLADLYPAMDSPAYLGDLERARVESLAFADLYRGKLADIAAGPEAGEKLATAIAAYEKLEDLLGRIMSYAGLVYSGDTTNPAHAKFYGDAQEKITAASSDLLFFQLELNRIDDAVLDAAMADGPLAHYKPWLVDIRLEKPYQLDDRIEQLFHEKSISGRSAWNRLFDETIADLRFHVEGRELTLEPVLNLMQDPRETVRRDASNAIAATLKGEMRTFALITNTLAKDKEIADRWRKFADVADSRHLSNRVEREVVDALVAAVHAAYPRLSHRYYKLKARWFGKEATGPSGTATRPCPISSAAPSPGTRRATWCSTPMAPSRPDMAAIARRFFDTAGSTRRCGRARRRAPSPIRPCLPPTPMCCSIIRASRAT
jgi:oligoendopeptidase F